VRSLTGKLTYANVVATLALFLAIGGGAYAATQLKRNSVGTHQLKKNAVTGAKIKNNTITEAKLRDGAVTGAKIAAGSLTGADFNLNSLGTVPSASNASSASVVNGQTPNKIFKTLLPGESDVGVASIAGYTITASCESLNVDLTLSSPAQAGSVLSAVGNGQPAGSTFSYEAETAGHPAVMRLDEGQGGARNNYGESAFSGATSTGNVISGELGFDESTFHGESPKRCVVFGEVTSG
jgi:hypothetical protein